MWGTSTIHFYAGEVASGRSLPKSQQEEDDPLQMGGDFTLDRYNLDESGNLYVFVSVFFVSICICIFVIIVFVFVPVSEEEDNPFQISRDFTLDRYWMIKLLLPSSFQEVHILLREALVLKKTVFYEKKS